MREGSVGGDCEEGRVGGCERGMGMGLSKRDGRVFERRKACESGRSGSRVESSRGRNLGKKGVWWQGVSVGERCAEGSRGWSAWKSAWEGI